MGISVGVGSIRGSDLLDAIEEAGKTIPESNVRRDRMLGFVPGSVKEEEYGSEIVIEVPLNKKSPGGKRVRFETNLKTKETYEDIDFKVLVRGADSCAPFFVWLVSWIISGVLFALFALYPDFRSTGGGLGIFWVAYLTFFIGTIVPFLLIPYFRVINTKDEEFVRVKPIFKQLLLETYQRAGIT